MNTNTIEKTVKTEEQEIVNGRRVIIAENKAVLVSVKPERDEKYGTVYQKLFVEDYVIYALLRNKQDFTSCSSTDRLRAINIAKSFKLKLEKYLSTLNDRGEAFANSLIPNKIRSEVNFDKKEVYTQLLDDINVAIEKAKEKYQ